MKNTHIYNHIHNDRILYSIAWYVNRKSFNPQWYVQAPFDNFKFQIAGLRSKVLRALFLDNI